MASKIVISPEPFVQKCKSLAKAKHLYVAVKDGSIRLAWSTFSEDGIANRIEYINRAEAIRLGIPYDLLLDAVLEGGGTIDGIGYYPVTEEIVRRLRKVAFESRSGDGTHTAREIRSYGNWQTMGANSLGTI
jgi:hypothetical protein